MKHLLALLSLIIALPLFAETEGIWEYSISGSNNATITGCTNPVGDLDIPETLNGYSVTSIGYNAFNGCSSLTSVTIPEGVTSIGSYAFYGCRSLTSVTIPEGVVTIGNDAFFYCDSLTSVTIPESVTSIENRAFAGCNSLLSLIIPEGVSSIKNSVFESCSSLTSLTIPESVTSIENRAFANCDSLLSLIIPRGVTSIEDAVFQSCSSLTSVTIPEGVTSIGGSAFSGCSSLTSVTIPKGVISIGSNAFLGCSSLSDVYVLGPPPHGWANISGQLHIKKEYAGAWQAVLADSQRGTLIDIISDAEVSASAEMTSSTTMKVTYTVKSPLETVKVRAVAFKDGVRSFANFVPVTQGEGVPMGEAVETNKEHTFVWNVSEDWDTDLDKVAVEILVQEGTLLPQELITIPEVKREGVVEHAAMTITRNALNEPLLFNALLWCMVEGDTALTNTDGVVRANGVQVASKTSISTYGTNATALLNYLYGKMGYKVLAGEDLTYAKAATRINFANSGIRQVAVKIEDQTSTEE